MPFDVTSRQVHDGPTSSLSTPHCSDNGDLRYQNYPLLKSMIQNEGIRSAHLKLEGKLQIEYTKSTDGWWKTLRIFDGRALDNMIFPWTIATVHAILFTVIQEQWVKPAKRDMTSLEVFFSFVFNSTLSFLLVFRLNRAAGRFWSARKYWGDIVAQIRSCVGGIIVHGDHNIVERDNTIRWIAAFTIATMELLRGETKIPASNLAGLLSQSEVTELEKQVHPPMYAIDKARYHLKQLFWVNADTPLLNALLWSSEMNTLEDQLNVMIWSGG
jgi:predicted membrane chloride channel (bestrophin family)